MNRILLTWKPVLLFCIDFLEIRQLEAEKKKITMHAVYHYIGAQGLQLGIHMHILT